MTSPHQTLIRKAFPMGHQSYLVRTWTEGPEEDLRISVQNVLTGERRSFYTIKDYINFLCTEMDLPVMLLQKSEAMSGERWT